MNEKPDVLTVDAAASELGVHPNTLYKHLRDGEIPAFKLGRVYRIRREAFESWQREKEREYMEGLGHA